MMRIVSLVLFIALSVFAKEQTMRASILDNVLKKNAEEFLNSSKKMQYYLLLSYKKSKRDESIKQVRDYFPKLVYVWKKVEATYVGGDLNEDMIDTPHMIDIFHKGNENISKQLEIIRNSKNKLETELYKNSHKSINALEYILFSKDKLSNKDIAMAIKMTEHLASNSMDILSTYSKADKFLENEAFANGALLNALIDSSYKTKQWRLGEALAKEKKFKTKDASRFEYVLSKQSLNALKAIVEAYGEVFDAPYEDFGDMAYKSGSKKEVLKVRKDLKELKTLFNSMKESDLLGKKGEKAYDILNEIYINYALYMVENLQITAKIIEADGD